MTKVKMLVCAVLMFCVSCGSGGNGELSVAGEDTDASWTDDGGNRRMGLMPGTMTGNMDATAVVTTDTGDVIPDTMTTAMTTDTRTTVSDMTGNSCVKDAPFIISVRPMGQARNNDKNFQGMVFTVGNSPLTVTSLGLWMVEGNAERHTVKLVDVFSMSDVPGGSVSINLLGATPRQFEYAALPAPITLAPNRTYYVVFKSDSDLWYDLTTTVTSTSSATVNGVVFEGAHIAGSRQSFSSWQEYYKGSISYGPVNFKYCIN